MLFMDIVTWDAKDKEEVLGRFEKWEAPEGINIIGEWDDLSSCRHIVLYDAEDSESYAAATFPWLDICRFDSFPVMESSETMKLIAEHMGYNPVV